MAKVRLIELFSGIGAQAKALKRLNIDFEHWRAIDNDRFAVASYNAIHGTRFQPADIKAVKGADLGISETDKYTYLMFYSFPCTDLSCSGLQKGMSREEYKNGNGTCSGLLWEVERLLNELSELPQILIMENVPQVHNKKNKPDFDYWLQFLASKGYKSIYKDLNAKDYGIPQSRNRTFVLSFLDNNVDYKFEPPIKLEKSMGDYLEKNIDKRFYVESDRAKALINDLVASGKIKEELC